MPDSPVSLGVARMLFGDAIIVFLLANEARRRIVMRVFGVSREDSDPVSLVAVGAAAGGLQSGAARVFAVTLPSAAAAGIAAATVREAAHAVAGESLRNTAGFGALLALAVVGTAFGPAVRGSFRGAGELSMASRLGRAGSAPSSAGTKRIPRFARRP